MKRAHIHLTVGDLDRSVAYYSALFGAAPDTSEAEYAKWSLSEPALNFAVSTGCGEAPGVSHVGIEVTGDGALEEMDDRIAAGGLPVRRQAQTSCCYARSDKVWTADPDGLAWEVFRTDGQGDAFAEAEARRELTG